MGVRHLFTVALLGVVAPGAAGCTRDVDRATLPVTGAGGVLTSAGGDAGATDARLKGDSACAYDVDAVPVSTENTGDACLFLVEYPTDPGVPIEAFRMIVDGVVLYEEATNGWTYTDATQRRVRLAGPACDAVKAGGVQTVWIEWYCTGIP
jgi:hypothetical protein